MRMLESDHQRTLQIEAEVGRLFSLDRAVQPKNLAAEHMIGRAVDRLDADKLALFVTERRERARLAVAAHHNLIVSGGETRDLELVVALVAPEPRQAVIGLGIAGQPCRHATRLVGRVLHGFKPERTAKTRARE